LGARFLADTHRGFGGFVIGANGAPFFHCGDSAYFEGFKKSANVTTLKSRSCRSALYDPPLAREVHIEPGRSGARVQRTQS